jgi:hypothetical protein
VVVTAPPYPPRRAPLLAPTECHADFAGNLTTNIAGIVCPCYNAPIPGYHDHDWYSEHEHEDDTDADASSPFQHTPPLPITPTPTPVSAGASASVSKPKPELSTGGAVAVAVVVTLAVVALAMFAVHRVAARRRGAPQLQEPLDSAPYEATGDAAL